LKRERKDIEKALEAKGFQKSEGDHHWFIYHDVSGKKSPVKTKTSHTPKAKTIAQDLFSRMARQVHLSNSQFAELVDCPLEQSGYERILQDKGIL